MSRPTLAVLLSRFPHPLDKGDKLRAFHQIRSLSLSCDIHLFTLCEDSPSPADMLALEPYCRNITIFRLSRAVIAWQSLLSVFRGLPVQAGYFFHPAVYRKFREVVMQLQPDALYLQLSRTAAYGRDLPFRKVIDFQDAFSLNYARVSEQSSGLRRWFYARESRLMRAFETRMMDWYDATTIISEFDRGHLERQPNKTVVVGNGVDTVHFAPQHAAPSCDLLFAGNLGYLPNAMAVEFIAEQLMPGLLAQKPDVKVWITGRSPELEKKYGALFPNNLIFKGWVPDVRDAYASARVFIAPLFTGAGVQNKILEAMSMELPCITTPVVNASLRASEGQALWLASDADSFVFRILELLRDEQARASMGRNARAFVQERYSWDKANGVLREVLFPSK